MTEKGWCPYSNLSGGPSGPIRSTPSLDVLKLKGRWRRVTYLSGWKLRSTGKGFAAFFFFFLRCCWLVAFAFAVRPSPKERSPDGASRGYAEALSHGKDGIMLVTMLEYIRRISAPWTSKLGGSPQLFRFVVGLVADSIQPTET